MAFDLRIFYSGLCVFAPQRENGNVKEIHVHLADTENGPEAAGVERHHPVVQYTLRNRWSDEPRYPLFTARDGGLRGLWELEDEDVDLVAVGGELESALKVDDTEPDSPASVTDENCESIRWIIPLHDRDGKVGRVLPDLAVPLDESKKHQRRVVARFLARNGRVFPASFSLHEGGQRLQLWDFDVPDQPPRAVATLVEQRIRVDAPMVRLRARKFGEERPRFRYLTLRPAHGEDCVEIWIMNRELKEITHQTVPPAMVAELSRDRASEIRLCYRLLQAPPVGRALPRPVHTGGEVKPGFFKECADAAMRPIYFPYHDGELISRPPCEPVWAEG